MPTRRELKQSAKLAMRGNKPSIYLITLVYYLLIVVLEVLTYKIMYPGLSVQDIATALMEGEVLLMDSGFLSNLFQFLLGLMSMTLGIGFMGACVDLSRGLAAGFGHLFDGFGFIFKIFCLNFVRNLYVALWSLLFIIPGIIASYRYSMAFYVLLDDPDLSVGECLRRSSEMMEGHKWEYFVLQLSFIGWTLLTVIPFVALYVEPYMGVTVAGYYNHLCDYRPMEETPPEFREWQDRDPWDS